MNNTSSNDECHHSIQRMMRVESSIDDYNTFGKSTIDTNADHYNYEDSDNVSVTDSIATTDEALIIGHRILPRPPKRKPKSIKHIPVQNSTVLSLVHHFDAKPLEEQDEDDTENTIDKARKSLKVSQIGLIQHFMGQDSILDLPIIPTFTEHLSTDSIDSFAHQIHEEVRFNQKFAETERKNEDIDNKLLNVNNSLTEKNSALTSSLVKFGIRKGKIRESIEMDPNASLRSDSSTVPCVSTAVIIKQTLITLRQRTLLDDKSLIRLKFYLPRKANNSEDIQIINVFITAGTTLKTVKNFIENSYPHQILKGKINNIFVADDDGDMDDDFPPINDNQDITRLGLDKFYIERVFETITDSIPENSDSDLLAYKIKTYANNDSKEDFDDRLLNNSSPKSEEYTFNQNNNILCCLCCKRRYYDESDDEQEIQLGLNAYSQSKFKRKIFSYEKRIKLEKNEKKGYLPPLNSNYLDCNEESISSMNILL